MDKKAEKRNAKNLIGKHSTRSVFTFNHLNHYNLLMAEQQENVKYINKKQKLAKSNKNREPSCWV